MESIAVPVYIKIPFLIIYHSRLHQVIQKMPHPYKTCQFEGEKLVVQYFTGLCIHELAGPDEMYVRVVVQCVPAPV